MADIEFELTAGPYQGKYGIDLADITANDVGDLINQGGPDLDSVLAQQGAIGLRVIAGLVWIVRRRGSKGLAYRAVADHVNMSIFEPVEEGETATSGELAGLPDPSHSDSD